MMKNLLKKIIPEKIINLYHLLIAILASFYYRFPSQEMIVIGVTGTKGKSTVINLTGRMLEQAGYKVGWVSSLNVKMGPEEFLNPWHMTMPGRFKIQQLLRTMSNRNCEYVLIEATSEGIKQWRHWGINFDTVCFTNLSPEHLKAHGSFEAYKKTKGRIFKRLSSHERKEFSFSPFPDKKIPKTIVANKDDQHSDYYLGFEADQKFAFGLQAQEDEGFTYFQPEDYQVKDQGSEFSLQGTDFQVKLPGKFNLENALAALTIARSQKMEFSTIKKALEEVKQLPGRMETIDEGQSFKVIVDLAHTPDSFEAMFEAVEPSSQDSKTICVFGAAGGDRDEWKRPELGKIADSYCDEIILTNEDPYQEDPDKIINDIAQGINESELLRIKDRRKAIRKSLEIAEEDDKVLILGKGTEATMVIGDRTISWDEREVTREELRKIK